MPTPSTPPTSPPLASPHAVERAVANVRLVDYLAHVEILRTPADCDFLYCTLEMARLGDVKMDQLLTRQCQQFSEMRYVCYHVLEQEAGLSWDSIATRFSKSKDSVRAGARQVRHALSNHTQFQALVNLTKLLAQSFTYYRNRHGS